VQYTVRSRGAARRIRLQLGGACNALPATVYFCLPPEQVIEIGLQRTGVMFAVLQNLVHRKRRDGFEALSRPGRELARCMIESTTPNSFLSSKAR
jgi:hypothetical protein